jgi:hypothetical protein
MGYFIAGNFIGFGRSGMSSLGASGQEIFT